MKRIVPIELLKSLSIEEINQVFYDAEQSPNFTEKEYVLFSGTKVVIKKFNDRYEMFLVPEVKYPEREEKIIMSDCK